MKLKTPINLNWKIILEAASGLFNSGVMKNCFKEATAPEITAVSYPNNNPPRVAVRVSNMR